mmetsp:Transcript_10767/g.32391  ORF Transcript_10767/g.32391 Transcript_10767/m.32391 type:complete len:205 (-) Transcript_10767:763-1377(-)
MRLLGLPVLHDHRHPQVPLHADGEQLLGGDLCVRQQLQAADRQRDGPQPGLARGEGILRVLPHGRHLHPGLVVLLAASQRLCRRHSCGLRKLGASVGQRPALPAASGYVAGRLHPRDAACEPRLRRGVCHGDALPGCDCDDRWLWPDRASLPVRCQSNEGAGRLLQARRVVSARCGCLPLHSQRSVLSVVWPRCRVLHKLALCG